MDVRIGNLRVFTRGWRGVTKCGHLMMGGGSRGITAASRGLGWKGQFGRSNVRGWVCHKRRIGGETGMVAAYWKEREPPRERGIIIFLIRQ